MNDEQKKPIFKQAWFYIVLAVIVVVVIIAAARLQNSGNDVSKGDGGSQTTQQGTSSSGTTSASGDSTKEASSKKDKLGMNKKDTKDVEKTVPGNHIYSKSVIKPVLNATRDAAEGRYSVVMAKSSECTKVALTDWYNNYVMKDKYNYCVIVYTDKKGMGCYAVKGLVFKDTKLKKEGKDTYYLGDSSKATTYTVKGEKLVDIKDLGKKAK